MSAEMCSHGYKFGMCPYGCQQSTTPATAMPKQERNLEPEEPFIPPPNFIERHEPVVYLDKLKCVICGQDVESGKVYKGKPICDSCMNGIKETKKGEE